MMMMMAINWNHHRTKDLDCSDHDISGPMLRQPRPGLRRSEMSTCIAVQVQCLPRCCVQTSRHRELSNGPGVLSSHIKLSSWSPQQTLLALQNSPHSHATTLEPAAIALTFRGIQGEICQIFCYFVINSLLLCQ